MDWLPSWEHAWSRADAYPERRLLRLALLRQLTQTLHAEKSRLLVAGKPEQLAITQGWENRASAIRHHPGLSKRGSSLGDLLRSTLSYAPGRDRPWPQALSEATDLSKLDRYDRQWERELAQEALQANWQWWSATAVVPIPLAQKFHLDLERALSPHGIVLYTETDPARMSSTRGDRWPGRWILIARSRPRLTGAPYPMDWKQLYAPR